MFSQYSYKKDSCQFSNQEIKTHEFVLEQLVTEEPFVPMQMSTKNVTNDISLEPIQDDIKSLIIEATLESVKKHPATFWILCGVLTSLIVAVLVYGLIRQFNQITPAPNEQDIELRRIQIPVIQM